MPAERISKSFRDVSLSLRVNPANSDLIVLRNENAISRAMRNLILTEKGERFFDPEYGSNVKKLLFENATSFTADLLKDEIEYTINNYEPRVKLIDVKVEPNYDYNEFNIAIIYRVIGIDVEPASLSFALQSTR